MQFINATVYLADSIIPNGYVEIQDGIITKVGDMAGLTVTESDYDLSGYILAPGFIDQHVHGAAGADTMDGTQAAIATIAGYLVHEGVTSFLATTCTMSQAIIHQALRTVATFKREQVRGCGAEVLGVHLEGPFINPNFKGAQDEKFIVEPQRELFDAWQRSAGNCIKMVTFAVEKDPHGGFQQHLIRNGVVPSCGHSGASLEQVAASKGAGLLCFTHLHNAMSGHHHQQPGVVSAAYCLDGLKIEMIADGVHVHPAVLKLVYQLKGSDSIIAITDATRAKGLPDGTYELGGQRFVKRGNSCNLVSGVLAGSVLSMDAAVRNMVKFLGCSLNEAVKMASLNPARLLGVAQHKGSIAVGKDADLVVLDQAGYVYMTVVGGNIVYRASEGELARK